MHVFRRLGKIDMDDKANKPVGGKFGVKGYPTLKIFRNGVASDYTGPRDAKGIVAFLKAEKAKVRLLLLCQLTLFGEGWGDELESIALFVCMLTKYGPFFFCLRRISVQNLFGLVHFEIRNRKVTACRHQP